MKKERGITPDYGKMQADSSYQQQQQSQWPNHEISPPKVIYQAIIKENNK